MSARTAGLRRLGQLLARARVPIFVMDADRRFVYGNPAFEELTGRDLGQLAEGLVDGKSNEAALPLVDLARELAPPAETGRGLPASARAHITHTSGERRGRRVEFHPLTGPGERPLGVLAMAYSEEAAPTAPESPSHWLRGELRAIRDRVRGRLRGVELVGDGPAHERLLGQIAVAATASAPAWIVAEPGSGARTVAGAIHRLGPTPEAPVIVFDVAALPADVLELEILGSTEDASVGHLPPGATLLLVGAHLVERDIQRRLLVALPGLNSAGVRLLGASPADPWSEKTSGQLRSDYYYAMTGLMLCVAPLRDRLTELPLLSQHFLERANRAGARQILGFAPPALDVLRGYDWPGNLSELCRVVESAHARAEGDLICAGDLPASIRGEWACSFAPGAPVIPEATLDATLETVERRLIERALQLARFNKSRAADRLGISRPRLYRRMGELGIADLPETTEASG